jgi:hypothetical protein
MAVATQQLGRVRRSTRRLLFWLGVCLVALISAVMVAGIPLLAAGIPLTLVGAVLSMRHPTPFVFGMFLLSAVSGSLAAFTGFKQEGLVLDLIILTLLSAAVMRFVALRRDRSMWVWPGVIAFGLYIGLTFCEILTSPDPVAGVDSFRTTALLMMIVLIIAYSGWGADTFDRMVKGVVVVGLLVGAYAVLRWVIGPAAAESSYAYSLQGTFVTELGTGRLFQLGSFADQHQLGLWTATVAPFCAAIAFLMRGRWRLLALAATALLIVGLFGSEVRSALVALAAGLVAVIVLFQLCRSHRGLGLGSGLLVAVVTPLAVLALYLLTVSPSGQSRFSGIFHPSEDQAYVQRQGKWAEAIRDLHNHPFGQGLGTAGATNQQYGRYLTIANAQFDNSYLFIAWQQGFAVMIFFGLALALLAADLARHAIRTLDPQRAAVALGAVGTIIALAVMFYFGSYLDAISIVGPWVLIGLGVAQFSSFEPAGPEEDRPARPHARTKQAEAALTA